MSKLLFQDDTGAKHEIDLTTVKVKALKTGDVVVAYYEVGSAKPDDCKMALEQLRVLLQKTFPENTKIAVIATRNGKKDVDLKILSGDKV